MEHVTPSQVVDLYMAPGDCGAQLWSPILYLFPGAGPLVWRSSARGSGPRSVLTQVETRHLTSVSVMVAPWCIASTSGRSVRDPRTGGVGLGWFHHTVHRIRVRETGSGRCRHACSIPIWYGLKRGPSRPSPLPVVSAGGGGCLLDVLVVALGDSRAALGGCGGGCVALLKGRLIGLTPGVPPLCINSVTPKRAIREANRIFGLMTLRAIAPSRD